MALTSQQIVTLATQAAGTPGWTSQAGQLLNMIASDLCQTYDLDVARGTVILNLTPALAFGPYPLPADYLRADPGEVFFTIQQVPYRLTALDLAEFDTLAQQAGNSAYPEYYATDMSASPPTLYVWPAPQGATPLTIRYRRQMADIATPESSATVPWFPNQDYLLTRLSGELMKLADDDRSVTLLGDGPSGAQGILNRYLKLKDDQSTRTLTVKLDPRRFGQNFNRLPGTKQIGPP